MKVISASKMVVSTGVNEKPALGLGVTVTIPGTTKTLVSIHPAVEMTDKVTL
jgi:hypothetical protein